MADVEQFIKIFDTNFAVTIICLLAVLTRSLTQIKNYQFNSFHLLSS